LHFLYINLTDTIFLKEYFILRLLKNKQKTNDLVEFKGHADDWAMTV